MKKGILIGFIVVIIITLGLFYFYSSGDEPEPTPSNDEPTPTGCADERERFSSVKDEYPEHCCEGLIEWNSGFDTRISIGDDCYNTMMASGYPVGTCINCGNEICEDIEDVCNCPNDCSAENSRYVTIEDFCNSGYEQYCDGLSEDFELELCDLCV